MTIGNPFRFDSFTLDIERLCLIGPAGQADLRPKSFDVLRHLVEHAGRLVTKDELIKAVWPNVTVTDESLSQCISEVRRILGDKDQRIIKTVPRRGYLINVPVLIGDGPVAPESVPTGNGSTLEFQPPTGSVARKLPNAGLAQPGGISNSSTDEARRDFRPRLSIVVLPFTNLSGKAEEDYFVDGVTESLTTDLSRISGSFVIGRHTAFTYKGKVVDLKQIGRELNVCYLLEGSVQRSGNRLRLNVQLIDTETATHLWADRFDKAVADLFDMQDEIVSRLAHTLGAQLVVAEARRAERSLHPDATDLVFQGRASLYKGWTPEYLAEARGFFERALSLDPQNIEAMVGIARVDLLVGAALYSDDRVTRLAAAEVASVKALSLAPNHARAHLILGAVLNSTNRAAQGIAECERALALDRNLARAHYEIGRAKLFMGLGEETEAHINEALRLSPRDIFAFGWLSMMGGAKLHISADAEAVDWFRRSIEANRNYPVAHFMLAAALALRGSLDQARVAAKAGLALDPSFTIRRFRDGVQSDNPTFLAKRERLYEGMRRAGVQDR